MDGSAVMGRAVRAVALSAVIAAAITACGGGGDRGSGTGSGSTALPTVSSAAAGTAKYGQKVLLTVNGSHLDAGLAVAASHCSAVTLSTTAPLASNATTAYYQCVVSAVGTGQFVLTRSSDGAALASEPFTALPPQVTMAVSNGAGVSGSIVVTLDPDKTPVTVDNFLAYVNAGFYDGTVIHRVSPGFVIQGGGYVAPVATDTPTAKPTSAPIALEVNKGLSNTQWTIAMARSCGSAPSTTSQFFINLVDNSGTLDPSPLPSACFANPPLDTAGYAVFGSVTAGTAAVTGIVGAPCAVIPNFLPSGDCTPTPNVVITSAVQTQ